MNKAPSKPAPAASATVATEVGQSLLALETVLEDGGWPPSVTAPAFCHEIAAALAQVIEFAASERAVIAFGSDNSVRALNKQFRGLDKPTNVLSFPAADPVRGSGQFDDGQPSLLGDIILARETVAREAEELSILFEHHSAHLIVHGILHLLGYDHAEPVEAEEMEALEIEVLEILGIENPYTEELVDAG